MKIFEIREWPRRGGLKVTFTVKYFSIFRQDEKTIEIKNGKCKFEKEGKYFISYYLDNSVNNLSYMFNDCNSLIKVYMPSFADHQIISMSNMFNDCYFLKEINFLSSFNTKILQIFQKCFLIVIL